MALTISRDRTLIERAAAEKSTYERNRCRRSRRTRANRCSIPKRLYTCGHLKTGLISTTGVPSIASMGPIRNRVPSIERTTTG